MAKYENDNNRRESREDYEDRRRAVQRQHYEEQQRMQAYERARQAQSRPQPQGSVQRRMNGGNVPPVNYPGERMAPPPQQPPKKKGGVVSVLSTILLIVAIGVFLFAGWKLWGYYKEYKKGSDEYSRLNQDFVSIQPAAGSEYTAADGTKPLTNVEELEHPASKKAKVDAAEKNTTTENGTQKELPTMINPIDFAELNAINPDIIGWIRLGALNLSYPVAQAKDNDYYLHRTFERVDNFAGCIFLNCDNSKYFTDQNTVVYGHNMKDGSMFGSLKNLKSQETYDGNPYFWIFAPEFIYQYRIFSCSVVSALGDPYRVRFTSDEFQTCIDTMVNGSVIDNHGLEVTTQDRIVTLSTCTGNSETRFIVQGKLEQVYIAKREEL